MTSSDSAPNGAESWDQEFGCLRVIPSTLRAEPSRSLEPMLLGLSPGLALDVGCGNGRNAAYLAESGWSVVALDYSTVALSMARDLFGIRQVAVTSIAADLRVALYDLPHGFDLGLDIYTSCHLIRLRDRRTFHSGIARVVRPGGHLLTVYVGPRDEYYQQFSKPADADWLLATDNKNGISKLIPRSRGVLENLFMESFAVARSMTIEFSETVGTQRYRKSSFALLLQRRG